MSVFAVFKSVLKPKKVSGPTLARHYLNDQPTTKMHAMLYAFPMYSQNAKVIKA